MRNSRVQEKKRREDEKKQAEVSLRQRERATRELIQQIATTLGETDTKARETIEKVVRLLGDELASALFQQTTQIEAEGGMMTADGSRRRTPGGVFMLLVKQKLQADGRKDLIKQIF